jgi:hypothetical protein
MYNVPFRYEYPYPGYMSNQSVPACWKLKLADAIFLATLKVM